MYKIAILGSTGFVGSHLSKYLVDLGYGVEFISKEQFQKADYGDILSTVDVVVNCAWTKDGLHDTKHLEFASMVCDFYQDCKDAGTRVINLGSSSEYGVKHGPMEEDMICEPVNTYGIAKLAVTLFAKKLGFNTLRLFTVYGDGSVWDMNKKFKKIALYKPFRHFIGIKAACMYIERLIHAEHIYGEIINIADENEPTLDRFYEENTKPGTYPQSQYEPALWVADTTKMKKLLNL